MIEHLSYSSVSMFLTCARSWHFKYILRAPSFATPELAFGSAIHGAVESFLQDRSKPPVEYWAKAWSKATNQKIFWGVDTPEQHYNEGIRILTNEKILYNLHAIPPVAKIEEKVTLRVPGVPVPVIGFIDIQTADGVPGDLKTSSKSWTQERAASETQSLFYLAALNQAGRTVDGWRFRHYVVVKTKQPQFQVYEHSHSADEAMQLFGMIREVWESIQRGEFPVNYDAWKCNPKWCDYWGKCRGKSGG